MLQEIQACVLAARRACQQWDWGDALESQERAWQLLQPILAANTKTVGPPAEVLAAYAELLDELSAAVQEVVQPDSAYPLEPDLKAELCWQVSLALRDRRRLPSPPPEWLAAMERQIVEEGFAAGGSAPIRRGRPVCGR